MRVHQCQILSRAWEPGTLDLWVIGGLDPQSRGSESLGPGSCVLGTLDPLLLGLHK